MAEMDMDIPGNSKKSQENKVESAEQNKPEIPVFDGNSASIKRKQNASVWRWFKRIFLSDRSPKEIAKEVFENTIAPSIQDSFRNGAMAMLDGIIYKNAASPSITSSNSVSYNKIYSSSGSSGNANTNPKQQDSRKEEINRGFNNPCFRTQNEAARFLTLMKGYDYPTLSVHTLYMMLKKHIDYTWDAYGWTKEEIMKLGPNSIRRINNPDWPYMIELPEAHVIS